MVSTEIHIPMPIGTERLLLRPLQAGDGKIIHEAKRESWSELLPWLVWTQKPLEELTVADDEAFCLKKQALFISREDITLLVFEKGTGKFLGGAGLHKPDWNKKTFSLGFWIRTSETGKGYATEVARVLVDYAFGSLSANTVFSFHGAGNTASQKVLENAGLRQFEIAPMQHKLLDRAVDEYRYKIERS
jgi:ribosomal-protein-serine acetyltransferase